MGQAKARGSYEERKAEAVARNKVLAAERREREEQEALERQRLREERNSRLTPEQRRRRQRANVGSIGGLDWSMPGVAAAVAIMLTDEMYRETQPEES